MLDVEYSWDDWKENKYRMARKEGYVLGKLIGLMDALKYAIRREGQYQKALEKGEKVSESLQKTHELYMGGLEIEKFQDIVNFAMKYPNLSNEQLAKRILWESEYRH